MELTIKLLAWAGEMVFGFFKGNDTDKHKRIVAAILIALLLPLAALEILGAIEKYQWFQKKSEFRV